MCRDLLCDFQTTAILQVRGNPRRPERVVSDLRMDAGSLCPPADHPIGIRLAHWPACERIGFPDRRAELRSLGIYFEARALDVRFQICVEIVICRHVVALATLFVQPDPSASPLDEESSTFMPTAAPTRAKVNTMTPMRARSRRPTTQGTSFFSPPLSFTVRVRGILSSDVRASSAVSTGVLPFLTECFGPRTAWAGFTLMM
jgi:hypothetical protein